MKKKVYVIDTNILMESPEAIYGFEDNTVVVTDTVLQELDRHKKDIGEPGYNARTAIRILESIVIPSGTAQSEYDLPNNGLSFAIDRFRKSGLVAQVSFSEEECVRSALAAEASRLLVN